MIQFENERKQVLLDMKTITDSLQLSVLIVGAGARILVFDSQFQISGRETIDLDFAVKVNSWSDFQALSMEMTQGVNSRFQATRTPHKFIHISTGIEVDIVPFGAIGQPNQKIQWSDGNQMNIVGFDEAFLTAESRRIEEVEFKVINISAFLVLKLLAWNDRKANKDLEDVYFILEKYNDDERVFTELLDELSQEVIKYDDASAFLLGRNIQKTFGETTINKAKQILTEILQRRNSLFPRLVSLTYEQERWDDKFDTIVARFEALNKGMGES
ncbi:MAG: nucleotidyl transferase AbiEii/AbiGii toxin family protein [Scytonematopsis contorta HA4267-MV1]|jgi:predicted nucleotidyltransferase|nr:nucleotidyl transferase AbiEii/AbiGii toxin family protein [Scytonematopsis contorta HA4267-MV1]